MVDNCELNYFMETFLKFRHNMWAVLAPNYEAYENRQMKAKQLRITSFFSRSLVSPSTMHSMSVNHCDNFQPGTDIIPTNTVTNVLMIITISLLHYRFMCLFFSDPIFPIRF